MKVFSLNGRLDGTEVVKDRSYMKILDFGLEIGFLLTGHGRLGEFFCR